MLLRLLKKILAISVCLPLCTYADIGSITEHKGSGQLIREAGDVVTTDLDVGILSYDDVSTANGRLKITFDDTTNLSLTEHSKITIDEFVFDPNGSDNKMSITFAMGTARFATGALGLMPKESIRIQTPTATIGIRGTDFTTTVDELGRSLVILLPDERTGQSSGEITVSNAGGVVVLSEAYQATMVSTMETVATPPVTLNIDLNLIDNMFIVTPPPAIKVAQAEQAETKTETNVLDFDALEFNELDQDAQRDKKELEFTELDMDLLSVDFLQDVLDVMERIQIRITKAKASGKGSGTFPGGVKIVGTSPGLDKVTQFNTIVDEGEGTIWFYREVNGVVSLRIPIYAAATIATELDDIEGLIIVGDGEAINIIIRQVN